MNKTYWIKLMKNMKYKNVDGIKDSDVEIYDGQVGEYLYFRRIREEKGK